MKNPFFLTRSDCKALLFMLLLGAAGLIIYHLTGGKEEKTHLTAADTILSSKPYAYPERTHRAYRQPYYNVPRRIAERFPFDPNTADSTQLLRLGLSPWQVRNIYKYRAKGGIYRKAEDFARLYGLTKEQYLSLKPYIRIGDAYQPASQLAGIRDKYPPYQRDTLLYPVKLSPTEHVVLNTADTTQLKKVPGIGSGWARRIVGYGSRLGGYVSVDQLRELDGFPEEALAYFVVSQPQTRKLNLNTLTLNQLRQHPYINFYQARAITDYRRLKGNLQSLDQLRLLSDFTPEAIQRLKPYVSF